MKTCHSWWNNRMTGVMRKGTKGQNFTFWVFTPGGFTNIFSIQKYDIYVFSMCMLSISIFVSYVLYTKYTCDVNMGICLNHATSNTLLMHFLRINIIIYHKRYNLSLNAFFCSSLSKKALLCVTYYMLQLCT